MMQPILHTRTDPRLSYPYSGVYTARAGPADTHSGSSYSGNRQGTIRQCHQLHSREIFFLHVVQKGLGSLHHDEGSGREEGDAIGV